ncbi:MAG: hypothetical protein GYA31_01445 [Parcubacteria group bacterium]|nr:hypothetical protein [Parcubacteria group bacterium]
MNKQILEKVTSIFLALILGISSGLSLANIAKAGGAYSITGDYSISGFTVTLSGTASANPYVGKCNDQHLSID